jgi:branched-chain amino acid transport system permease protein
MAEAAAPAPPRLAAGRLIKDAVLAALVALALAVPLVGFQTVEIGGSGLTIRTRFDWVAIGVASAFLGRLALGFWRAAREGRPAASTSGPARAVVAFAARHGTAIGALGLGFAVVLPFLPFSSRYLIDLATTILIYVMLGWGLNVVVGLAGLLDLGYVAFYAVGAYSFALFAQWFELSFWQALPISGILAASFGIILGFPVLRLRGDYLAIVTLGFGEIIRIILINWSWVTGGPNGVANIPRPTFLGMPFARTAPQGTTTFHQFFGLDFNADHRIIFLYFVILALALCTNAFTLRLRRLPIGRAWEALREDEIACRALGINPTSVKLSAFAIGAMLGGFAGAFFATRQGFISPESFTFLESAIILAIVVLGGMGSQLGVVLAAIVLVTLPELGREFAQFRMLVFGMAMVAIMVWRPRGLLAYREPSLRLFPGGSEARRGSRA